MSGAAWYIDRNERVASAWIKREQVVDKQAAQLSARSRRTLRRVRTGPFGVEAAEQPTLSLLFQQSRLKMIYWKRSDDVVDKQRPMSVRRS